jgi:TorA maturation chaperone TorD
MARQVEEDSVFHFFATVAQLATYELDELGTERREFVQKLDKVASI